VRSWSDVPRFVELAAGEHQQQTLSIARSGAGEPHHSHSEEMTKEREWVHAHPHHDRPYSLKVCFPGFGNLADIKDTCLTTQVAKDRHTMDGIDVFLHKEGPSNHLLLQTPQYI